jgi:TRAP-type C4-dicarboxylate transport system permease small subunit
MVVIVAAVAWGVLTRYVTAQPAAWASEVAAIGFAWLTFFGASACVRHNAHPSIDFLVKHLPPRLQAPLRYLNDALVAAFLAYFIWLAAGFSIDALDNPTPVLRLPMTIVYGPVTVALLLMLVHHLRAAFGPSRGAERMAP